MSTIRIFLDKIEDNVKNLLEQNDYNILNINSIIKNETKKLFPKLNFYDLNNIINLSIYLFDYISNKFYFDKKKLSNQWTQNNNRDIKSIILKILPFIDDKDKFKNYKKITDLNMILYDQKNKFINKNLLDEPFNDVIAKHFSISNFSLGLINQNYEYQNKNSILDLIDKNGDKLIYHIIHNNFIFLLETIKITCNKLYINWINILPICEENLSNTNVYKSTINYHSKINHQQDIISLDKYFDFEENNNGIYLGEFYNVFRVGFYSEIKKIKWTIFNIIPDDLNYYSQIDKTISKKPFRGKYFIQIIDYFLNILSLSKLKNFNNLSYSDKTIFEINFKKLLEMVNIKSEIFQVLKELMSFLVNNYKNSYLLNKKVYFKYKIFDYSSDETEIEDMNDIDLDFNKKTRDILDSITEIEIVNDFNNIEINHIFDYLSDCMEIFKNTIYSQFLIDSKNNSIDQSFFFINDLKFFKGDEIDYYVNLKNIYNFAKTLSHKIVKEGNYKYELLSENYQSLSLGEKIDFFKNFFSYDSSWFSITKNLIRQGINFYNIDSIKKNINSFWINRRIDLLFFYLIRNGLISEYKENVSLTSNLTEKNRLKYMKDNSENINSKNSYYFLTNTKYDDINVNNDSKSNFLKTIIDQRWYSFYAMDWLSQISFFHQYLNHQIIFVTGSTGTGKSTQVPKLLLYALKSINYNNKGKICCTQPRIPPTIGNSNRISEELGLPIEINSNIKSDNYYVQYKYSEDRHISKSNKHLQLTISTDGTLYNEILENPNFKEKKYTNNKKTDFEFSDSNLYDIIIVDEAHEHNKNMDLILSLSKNVCFYNNSVKLVIISATMDDDEPIYRSYFKSINDNLVYPLKRPLIKNKFTNEYNFIPELNYLDRRFHISPPGQTTQYIITENFKFAIDDTNPNISDQDYSIIIQKNSYDAIDDIISKSKLGNILLFLNGLNEIQKATEELNKRLPSDSVALPYFGRMNQKYKLIIQNIDTQISNIKNNKINLHNEWGEEYIKGESPNNFKRAIIIATNVAEASITIPNLKFVVDNGYSKENIIDETTNEVKLSIKKISNSSMVQRKGRVGRISDGTIYYLYNKSSRENIKTKYKISNESFIDNFLGLLNDESKRKLMYFINNEILNPYGNNFNIEESKIKYKTSLTILSLIKILEKQYLFNKKEKIPEDYFKLCKNKLEDFKKNVIDYQKINGFISSGIIDSNGNLFLIHYLENSIERNIDRKIINFNKIKTDSIPVMNIDRFIQPILNSNRFVNYGNTDINYQIIPREINIPKHYFYKKTILSSKIEKIGKIINEFDFSKIITIVMGYTYNIYDDVILVVSLLDSCQTLNGFDIHKLFEKEKSKNIGNYNSNKSDLESILNIATFIYKTFNSDKFLNINNILNLLKIEYNNKVSKFEMSDFKLGIEYNILKQIMDNGNLNNKKGFSYWVSHENTIKNYIAKIDKNKLNSFCQTHGFEPTVVYKFIKIYITKKLLFMSLDKLEDSNYDDENIFDWIDTIKNSLNSKLMKENKIDKLVSCFLIGYINNVAIYDKIEKKYRKPIDLNYFTISEKNSPFLKNMSNLIFYLNKNTIISNINEEDLVKINPFIYNPDNLAYIEIKKEKNKCKLIEFQDTSNYYNFINNIKKSFNKSKIIWNIPQLPILQNAIKNLK